MQSMEDKIVCKEKIIEIEILLRGNVEITEI
jgi:hypothetical protein